MRSRPFGWIVLAALFVSTPAAAQGNASPIITSPVTDQVLQGQVAVKGTTDIPNFASAELEFGYVADPTNTTFLIEAMTEPIDNDLLATWDTTSISDGDYLLLLRVDLTDGTQKDMTVAVKVRNYTALPTPTSTAVPTEPPIQIPTPILLAPTVTLTLAPLPTPTPFLPNPASTNQNEIYGGFWRGALIVLLLFIVFGIVIRLRHS